MLVKWGCRKNTWKLNIFWLEGSLLIWWWFGMHYYMDSHALRSSFLWHFLKWVLPFQHFMQFLDIFFVTGIMMGTLLMGLSFGSFYTVIVPMVNEMYGNLEFGKMWGAQITSQATNLGFLGSFWCWWMGDNITSLLFGDFVIRFYGWTKLSPPNCWLMDFICIVYR